MFNIVHPADICWWRLKFCTFMPSFEMIINKDKSPWAIESIRENQWKKSINLFSHYYFYVYDMKQTLCDWGYTSHAFIPKLSFSIILELEESILDALGILPKRKQHKKLLLVCIFYILEKTLLLLVLPKINLHTLWGIRAIFLVHVAPCL